MILSRSPNLRAGRAHLVERTTGIAWMEVDAGYGIGQYGDAKALTQTVEHGRLHAVVGRDPANEQLVDSTSAQIVRERASRVRMTVERGVALSVGRVALADHDRLRRQLEGRPKRRTGSVLNTVRRPLSAGRLEVPRLARMPVARRVDRLVTRTRIGDVPVQRRHNRVAAWCRERTPGAEIVLHVHDQQSRVRHAS